jgi:hypothetical protein
MTQEILLFFAKVEKGVLRIRGISETRIWGDINFDISAPQTDDGLVVGKGRFEIKG